MRAKKRAFLLFAAAFALVACVVASYYFLFRDDVRHGTFWEKYQRVQFGMTQKEVEAILGPSADEEDFGGIGADHACGWQEKEQRINVYFNCVRKDGEYGAYRKTLHVESGWNSKGSRTVDEQQLRRSRSH